MLRRTRTWRSPEPLENHAELVVDLPLSTGSGLRSRPMPLCLPELALLDLP